MKVRSNRMSAFQSSVFTELKYMKTDYENRTGIQTIDFSIGAPNIAPQQSIMEELARQVMVPDNYKYAIIDLDKMQETIQKWYLNRYQVELSKDEMVCVQGSQEALSELWLSVVDEGDIVLVPDPYYPVFADGPKIAGAKVVSMPLKEENDYLIDFDEINPEIAKEAKAMLVSYPNNPTCAVAPDSFYEKLIAFAKKYDLFVLHDNAYSELVFDGKVGKSFLAYEGAKDVGVELNSFSKTFGIAGARLGVCVGNKDVIDSFKMLKSNMDYGIFLPIQYAGMEALINAQDSIKETCKAYERRRDLVSEEFLKAGWYVPKSPATMFAWAKIPDKYETSMDFVKDLLNKTGIVVTPGQAFGKEGDRYVRLALVEDEENIKEAARRMAQTDIFC